MKPLFTKALTTVAGIFECLDLRTASVSLILMKAEQTFDLDDRSHVAVISWRMLYVNVGPKSCSSRPLEVLRRIKRVLCTMNELSLSTLEGLSQFERLIRKNYKFRFYESFCDFKLLNFNGHYITLQRLP